MGPRVATKVGLLPRRVLLSRSYASDLIHPYPHRPTDMITVFSGHDASRALAKTSLKAEDVVPEWEDLGETEKKTLSDWETFFEKRYNVVGFVDGAGNRG